MRSEGRSEERCGAMRCGAMCDAMRCDVRSAYLEGVVVVARREHESSLEGLRHLGGVDILRLLQLVVDDGRLAPLDGVLDGLKG